MPIICQVRITGGNGFRTGGQRLHNAGIGRCIPDRLCRVCWSRHCELILGAPEDYKGTAECDIWNFTLFALVCLTEHS